MKKTIGTTLLVLISLMFFFTQAFASSGSLKPPKPPDPNETPEVESDDAAGEGMMSQHPGKKYNFKGEVESFDGSKLVITGKKGGTTTVDANTKIFVAGPDRSANTIQVGQQVMAQSIKAGGGFLALRVHIFPNKPAHVHRVGEVTAYQPGSSITIQDKKGSTTFTLASTVRILPDNRANQLQVGSRVTVITTKDKTTKALTVVGIVVHPAR